MQKGRRALLGGLVVCLLSACAMLDSRQASVDFARQCAGSALNSRAILDFGPSNQLGPGSIWSRLGGDGGYQPQWRVQDLGMQADMIERGAAFQCHIEGGSQLAGNAALWVTSAASNVSAEVRADFSQARKVHVSVERAAWDTIVAGPYFARLRALPDAGIRSDVAGPNRLVLRRALRLEGYKVVLDFDAGIKPTIRSKYAGRLLGTKTLGDVGAQLSAIWTREDRLELSARGEVYVAGEFAPLVKGEMVSTKGAGTLQELGNKTIVPYQPR